ncbi:acyl-CoA dehydrogenase [Ectobacillus polymachus]|uniref:acyl-CoA dehydrogenase n=1 Tax=Ectobacillus polymachus TaxID=1508806 RepID=UPI003A879856
MFDEQTVQVIRNEIDRMEKLGTLTPEVLEIIYEQRLFKLFIPNELHGNMTPFPKAIKMFEEAAWIDGSFGWLVQIGSGAGFFVTTMLPDVATDIFSKRDVFIAGSDRPTGIAKKIDGGYLVTGNWSYCSGSVHASVFTANCRLETDDEKNGSIRAFIFTPEQVEIEKDWHAFGLKATGSHTIHVTSAFVPEERTFDVAKPHYYYDHPVFHYPFIPFAEANIASTTIGIARHFFDEAKAHSFRKRDTWDSNRFQFVIDKIEEMEAPFTQAVRDFFLAIEASWQTHVSGAESTDDELCEINLQCKKVAHHAVQGAQVLFRYLGMDAIMEHTNLNRIYRDLHTASQHKLLISYE